jgi:hypothetical protein
VIAPSPLIPRKLRRGDTIRAVAPSRSRALVAEHDHSDVIDARFAAMGLRLTFGDHVDERDDFDSSPVTSRVFDLHAAFTDPDVAGILTVIGGFNSNQLLPHLDWDLIAAHPKFFCGYSDITALQNAILAWTDDLWFLDQDHRPEQPGAAGVKGVVIGRFQEASRPAPSASPMPDGERPPVRSFLPRSGLPLSLTPLRPPT